MDIKSKGTIILVSVLLLICLVLIFFFIGNKKDVANSNEIENVESNENDSVSSNKNDSDESTEINNDESSENDMVEKFPRNETIIFSSLDGLEITADLYLIDKTSPIILLFHRASWSRGEYLEIAPKLNELGYNAMAIDARSGYGINDVLNETYDKSFEARMGTDYDDAAPDIEATIQYANEELGYDSIITWGSSYSASLVVAIGQKYSDTVYAVISFSPGEYFELENKTISEYAKELNLPTFVTGARPEKGTYEPIFEAISSNEKVFFVPEADGKHGSEALWSISPGNEEYWEAVTSFLNSLK